jgi:hypothetical protein
VDLTFESHMGSLLLPNVRLEPGPAVAAAVGVVTVIWLRLRQPLRVFMCCQQTPMVQRILRRKIWYRPVLSMKAAMPPFNHIEGVKLQPGVVEYNLPVFGPGMTKATMALFDDAFMMQRAAQLGVRIPTYRLDPFVIGKLDHVSSGHRAACAAASDRAAAQRPASHRLAVCCRAACCCLLGTCADRGCEDAARL